MTPISKAEYKEAFSRFSYQALNDIVARNEVLGIEFKYTIVSEDGFGYWVNFNNSSKFTSKTKYCGNKFTLLRQCSECSKVSTPKKIQVRHLYGLQFEAESISLRFKEHERTYPMLCMGCYNKVKPMHEKLCDNEELRLDIGRLKREIYKLNKKETDK